MASSGKRKTTTSKLNREAKLRERRFEKEARKQLRKRDQINPQPALVFDPAQSGETIDSENRDAEQD